MTYQTAYPDSFIRELGSVPKKIREAVIKTAIPLLRQNPIEPSQKLKKLDGYENFWRCRVGKDYRLIYHVDRDQGMVTPMMLGHRAGVYERIHYDPDDGPTSKAVLQTPDLFEVKPTDEEVGRAAIEVASTDEEQHHIQDQLLPRSLDRSLLSSWGIADRYIEKLVSCSTESELLALAGNPVPNHVIERVMNGLWPRPIEQVVNLPARVPRSDEQLGMAIDGKVHLDTFLLKLDRVQRPFVDRFRNPDPTGPWLLKGGPGSGKSTIALYCISDLLKGADDLLERPSLQVLFATYTNSLKRASEHLLHSLGADTERHHLEISTVDRLARDAAFPKSGKRPPSTLSGSSLDEKFSSLIADFALKDPVFPFKPRDQKFLLEELEWVILGQGLNSRAEYLDADRAGRGRVLGKRQREQVWSLYEQFRKDLKRQRRVLFRQITALALDRAKPRFDYVFIDEAQDLTPIAIRLCIKLCKDPKKVFLTADLNQSIYGSSISWKSVAEDLNFSGRARILRRNYRSTAQIWQGIQQISEPLSEPDLETLDEETVFDGPFPKLAHYSDASEEVELIDAYLHSSLVTDRASPDCAAVLCPTNKVAQYLASKLDRRLRPSYMESRKVELSHPGVKVMTIHAAKGLEFPVVVVARVNQGLLPMKARGGVDYEENQQLQRRLFFVACSRSMRHLLVLTKAGKESPFVSGLTEDYWEIDGVA